MPPDSISSKEDRAPCGDIGDFGGVLFVDGRMHRHINLSANLGYIFNSNPKGPNDDVLLDRPDELLAGVGFDFPINERFQPIAEVRSTTNMWRPTHQIHLITIQLKLLGGMKIYPRRWFGFGVAYRRHLNQQDDGHFNPTDFNLPTLSSAQMSRVPGRGSW